MKFYELKGSYYTINDLAEMSDIAPQTLRARLRQGYSVEEAVSLIPVHESVKEFCAASLYTDWLGMSISDLHKIYWKWCVSHEYTPLSKQGFSRQVMSIYPVLKIVPSKCGDSYCRIIRMRG